MAAETDESNFGSFPEDQLTRFDAEIALEATREQFFTACSAYNALPFGKNRENLSETAEKLMGAWGDTATAILGDDSSDEEEKSKLVGELYVRDDALRVEKLKIVTKDYESFGAFPGHDGLVQNINDALISGKGQQEILESLKSIYKTNLEIDLNTLRNVNKRLKMMEWGRIVGKHTLDVAKIGAGVLIAGKVASYMKRTNS